MIPPNCVLRLKDNKLCRMLIIVSDVLINCARISVTFAVIGIPNPNAWPSLRTRPFAEEEGSGHSRTSKLSPGWNVDLTNQNC